MKHKDPSICKVTHSRHRPDWSHISSLYDEAAISIPCADCGLDGRLGPISLLTAYIYILEAQENPDRINAIQKAKEQLSEGIAW